MELRKRFKIVSTKMQTEDGREILLNLSKDKEATQVLIEQEVSLIKTG